MNESEAQLAVHKRIQSVLLDFTESAITPDLEEDMSEVAEVIVEALGLDVYMVDGITIHATLDLSEPS